MLKRRIVICISCVLIFLNSLNGSLAATTIGEDVTVEMPLKSEMESESDLELIRRDITTTSGTVTLSEDKISGKFSTAVTIYDIPNEDSIEYFIAESNDFDINSHSRVRLWVKPGGGANWIEFYTNNSLINCNKDQDGRFKVGGDLISGKWNEVILDLTRNENNISLGDDLMIKSNDNSIWGIDKITTDKALISTVNLSGMVNSKTCIFDGMLRFKTTTEGVFDATPTILTTKNNLSINNLAFSKTDGISEFQLGILENAQIVNNGSNFSECLRFNPIDDCTGGTAISGGYYNSTYAQTKAFDNDNISTYWMSSQTGAAVNGVAYIGYDFGKSQNVQFIRIQQSGSYDSSIDSVKLQYFDDTSSNWINVQTLKLVISEGWQLVEVNTQIYANKWRLLANGNPGSRWIVYELEMGTSYGTYTSPEIDLTTINEQIKNSRINWNGTSNLLVKTSLSLDNGETWGQWETCSNNSIIPGIISIDNYSSVKFKYKVTGIFSDIQKIPELYEASISLFSAEDIGHVDISNGMLSNIHVDTNYIGVDGNVKDLQSKNTIDIPITYVFALSGDGKILYYPNSSDGGKLYRYNLLSGKTTKISDRVVTGVKTNYDGSILAFTSASSLYLYNPNSSPAEKLISSNVNDFIIKENGSIVYSTYPSNNSNGVNAIKKYFENASSNVYTYSYTGDIKHFSFSTTITGDMIFYSTYDKKLLISTRTVNQWKNDLLYQGNNYITNIYSNKDGTMLYLGMTSNPNLNNSTSYYIFDVESKALRKIDIDYNIKSVIKVTDDDKLFFIDSSNRFVIFNSTTNQFNEITPSDALSNNPTRFDINPSGDLMIYSSIGYLKSLYMNEFEHPEKYLLSFDGKNSWHTYKNGIWQQVKSGQTPDMNDFTTYGMTVDEVNVLSESDFKKLYENGRQVYSVDFAIYFTSIDSSTSPNIKSITITTNESRYDVSNNLVGKAVYTAKKQDFAGENWRKVNRLYPVETQPKEASFYYFIQADGRYSYYNGTEWVEETNNEIADLLTDVEENWGDILAKGMSTERLKAIPKEALTQKLANKNFSVVYCMKVMDESTERYSSKIVADYVEELFTSETLVLKVTMTDGSVKEFTNLTKTEVEDFMEWVYKRQHNMGPVFYTIKVANTSYFMNYYTIQSVAVDE